MRLIYRMLLHLSYLLLIVMAIWSALFYFVLIDEINDETDDSLEDYSSFLISRFLSGEIMPSNDDGTNNGYYFSSVSDEYAQITNHIRYSDEDIYIAQKKEFEPARILRTIFLDKNKKYYELTVSTPTIEKDDLKEDILYWMLGLYLCLIILILLVNLFVLQRNMEPLYGLLKWLDNYTIGKTSTPPNLQTSISEFSKLNEAATAFVNRNQNVYDQQKQFIGKASHELQTPLAVCQNRLEMMVENCDMTEKQLTELSKVQQTLSYLIRLNKSFLFLYKIENGQYHNIEKLCLNDIVSKTLSDYKEVFAHKEIEVECVAHHAIIVEMDETLAFSLVANLLRNAFVHNRQNGIIKIELFENSMFFGNTGVEESLDMQRVFKPLYRGNLSNTLSTGLGLSIADAICNLYNYHLTYDFVKGLHCFTIKFSHFANHEV